MSALASLMIPATQFRTPAGNCESAAPIYAEKSGQPPNGGVRHPIGPGDVGIGITGTYAS
jgi:hypothetical protein